MKRFAIIAASTLLLGGTLIALAAPPFATRNTPVSDDVTASPPHALDQAPLIVHEWGTFTSFSGSDGIKLEFRPLLRNDLPAFVYNRNGYSVSPFSKQSLTALQRMETPVTYFYTPIERDVTVRVAFPEGLLTEYYPPVRHIAPEPNESWSPFILHEAAAHAEPPLKDSLLDWGQVHLIPTAALRAQVADDELSRRIGKYVGQSIVPPAAGFTHYAAARETDSAIVQVRQDSKSAGPVSTGIDYFEKFLFYRGVGNFDLPLKLSETTDGTFELANAGRDEIRSLFLVTVEGKTVRFNRFDAIAAGDRMTLAQSPAASGIDRLAESMVTSLTAEGLYEKEARAMVKCWRSSWFGEEGTRLLYMVPAAVTDQLLPLHVEPPPDEVVRVLVGRMEIMPASQEERVLNLVKSSAAARLFVADEDLKSFSSPSLDALLALGRLAEPALVRTKHLATDDALRDEATRLITELHAATQ